MATAAPTTSARSASPLREVGRLTGRTWAVVAVFAGLAVWRSLAVGVPFRDPSGEWVAHRVLGTALLLAVLVPAEAAWRSRSTQPRVVAAAVRARWDARRVLLSTAALAAYHTTYFCYHNLKSWNAFRTVHDDWLEAADRFLFLGNSPAVLLHDVLGTQLSTWVLIGIYEFFPTVVTFGIVLAVVLPRRIEDGVRLLAALVWVWMLGTATYYAIPSLGPFHQSPADFAALPHSMVTDTQARYMAERAFLLRDPSAPTAHAQVAAFASLHIGVSATFWLGVRRWAPPWLFRTLGVYVALTAVATIQIGWHFAVDDVAGLAIAALAVAAARWSAPDHGPPEGRERVRLRRAPGSPTAAAGP